MTAIATIQTLLRESSISAWLLYDFRGSNSIAWSVLGIPPESHCTRRWAVVIPAVGEPIKLVHAIENFTLLVSNLKNEILTPDNFAHKDFLKHLLKLFLISIQRLGKRNNYKNSSFNNQNNITLLKFKQALEINFKNVHSVKEYASILNISSKTLTNHTTEIALKTPLELINDRIILEAKRLLSHSSLNINEIGFQLGYEDPSYFVKFFKRQTKKSPSDFRKAIS